MVICRPNGYFIGLYRKNIKARAVKGDQNGKGSVIQLNRDWQLVGD